MPSLSGLGYRIVPASTRGRFDDDSWKPDLRIVDERHVDRLPVENYLPRTPIIVLGSSERRTWQDPRVVGHLRRPADLNGLYPLIQIGARIVCGNLQRKGIDVDIAQLPSCERIAAHLTPAVSTWAKTDVGYVYESRQSLPGGGDLIRRWRRVTGQPRHEQPGQ